MKKAALLMLLSLPMLAQNAPIKPPTCVILSSAEPATGMATWSLEGRARKHMLTYLAGDYPPGVPFRSTIKDKDVDKIKAAGGRVLILDPHYTREDLDKAKAECAGTPPAKQAAANETRSQQPAPTPSSTGKQ